MLASLVVAALICADDPVPTRVVGGHLERGGRRYEIKGAGGDGSPALLARLGGNSIRTWGADRAGTVLDEAHKQGLTVTLGIWLGHERHGFKYDDPAQVAAQREKAREVIVRYKDHPALLMWGLGNEMEGYGAGDKPAIWRAVEEIAALAHSLDKAHPTMTVVAEIGGGRVGAIHTLCPSIDVVGINSYAGAASIPRRYKAAGGAKPYVLTEFGPAGFWESPKTAWGTPIEPGDAAKAETYRRSYIGNRDEPLCLGSYAFLWGHKQEATGTWFGMLLKSGERTASADAMGVLWAGKPAGDRAPTLGTLKMDGPGRCRPGARLRVSTTAADPEGGPVTVAWELRREGGGGTGGDAEAAPESFPRSIAEARPDGVRLTMPDRPGPYRLFAVARDGRGGAAVANLPLLVERP